MDRRQALRSVVRAAHERRGSRSERTIATSLMGLRQPETFVCERPSPVRCTDERGRVVLRPTLSRGRGLTYEGTNSCGKVRSPV